MQFAAAAIRGCHVTPKDYMTEWCARADFRASLPDLLHGEDPAFAQYLRGLLPDGPEKTGA